MIVVRIEMKIVDRVELRKHSVKELVEEVLKFLEGSG